MTQHDFNIANQSFPSFRTDLNNALTAINSFQSGTSRPASAVVGTIWLDTTTASTPTLKYYDGADDISLATLDHASNTVNWLDSTVAFDIINDITPQLGGMLDVNGQAIGNGTEELIKFSETASAVNEITVTNSATGTAPEISATGDDTDVDLKITPKGAGNLILDGFEFPNIDGTAGQVLQTDGYANLSFADVSGGTNTPAFEAYLSANQTVSNDTDTKIQFDTKRFDTNNAYDNVTNYRFTPQVAGKYFIYGICRSGPTSGLTALEKMKVFIYLNGSQYSAGNTDFRANNGTTASNIVNATISLNGTTDYIEIFGQTDVSAGTPIFYSVDTLFGAYKIIE
jgi:hypothetical protein